MWRVVKIGYGKKEEREKERFRRKGIHSGYLQQYDYYSD